MLTSAALLYAILWGLLFFGSYHEFSQIYNLRYLPDIRISHTAALDDQLFKYHEELKNDLSSSSPFDSNDDTDLISTVSSSLLDHPPSDESKGLREQYHGILGRDENNVSLWKPLPLDHELSYDEIVASHAHYCFNSRVSKSIALDRDIEDFRSDKCKEEALEYSDLPSASVVMIFHNEEFSVLLRSVHSILNRTPPKLLTEIILVDDKSNYTDFPWLHERLDLYASHLPKTRILRLQERHGLMRARVAGINEANSSIVVILDSHIEVGYGWLEPLVDYIIENPRSIVIPTIGSIHTETFDVSSGHQTILGFTWTLGQKYLQRDQSSGKPVPSPVMAGGLFAVEKSWFETLGGYDDELQLYGGEEFELAFKTWMCNGSLIVHPCSHVAHVFRTGQYWKHQVYKVPSEIIHRNKLRVANVWMDEYAKIINQTLSVQKIDIGSLEKPLALREKLHCKSFKWYLDNIYPEALQLDLNGSYIGQIQHIASNRCFDTYSDVKAGGDVKLYPCHDGGVSQTFFIDGRFGLVRAMEKVDDFCIGVESTNDTPFKDLESKGIRLKYMQDCDTLTDRLIYDRAKSSFGVQGANKGIKFCIQPESKPTRVILASCTSTTEHTFRITSTE